MVDDQLRIDGAMSRLVSDSMCLRPYSLSVLSAGKLDIARLWVRLDHHAAPRHRAVAWRRIAAVKFDVIELVARALTHCLGHPSRKQGSSARGSGTGPCRSESRASAASGWPGDRQSAVEGKSVY